MKRVLCLVSMDWHAGNANGILAPGTVLKYDDPGEPAKDFQPSLNGQQERLWNLTNNIIQYVERCSNGDPVIMMMGGDIVHGNRFTEFLVSSRMSHQVAIALQYFNSIYERLNVQAFYAVHGTDCHVFGEGSAEEIIAEMIREKYKIESVSSAHAKIDIDGYGIDLSHTGPNVGRAWTDGNPVRLYLRRAMIDDCDVLNSQPANLYLRGHVHGYGDESDKIERNGRYYRSRLIVVPAMCSMNGYARAATRSMAFFRHGMVMLEIVDGELRRSEAMIKSFDSRSRFTAGIQSYKFRGRPPGSK